MTALRGMTWRHPRGYDPLVACSALWHARTGVDIAWEQRSLQDFESYPVEELARRYDLIVIDHPHVGQVVREGCLRPLNQPERAAALAELAAHSVGPSYASYVWDGRLWALPIDAATQVQAYRPDLLAQPPATWDAMMALAREGRVRVPLRPPHALMLFCTLCANLGAPCATDRGFVPPDAGAAVWDRMAALFAHLDPACLDEDPIAVSERLSEAAPREACAPYIYGYVSYARPGHRPARLAFTDIPAAGAHGPAGTVLGGTGIAVSAFAAAPEAAEAFAFWLASADAQRGPYAQAGGQPGHGAAWDDAAVNAAAPAFFRATRATLESAWVRPRFDGYMAFQDAASRRINAGLAAAEPAAAVLADLDALFARARGAA